jgi:hypothetical protein
LIGLFLLKKYIKGWRGEREGGQRRKQRRKEGREKGEKEGKRREKESTLSSKLAFSKTMPSGSFPFFSSCSNAAFI